MTIREQNIREGIMNTLVDGDSLTLFMLAREINATTTLIPENELADVLSKMIGDGYMVCDWDTSQTTIQYRLLNSL